LPGPSSHPLCEIPFSASLAQTIAQTIKSPGHHGQAKTAEQRLYECIVSPHVHVVPGFQPNVMYQNYGKDLTRSLISDLVAYLMTLKEGRLR
jgi:hypothetical protein